MLSYWQVVMLSYQQPSKWYLGFLMTVVTKIILGVTDTTQEGLIIQNTSHELKSNISSYKI